MNTLKQSELIGLLGLSSTDPKIIQFFEHYDLGKLPKTITANQGTKSIIYRPLNISFWFKYDIKNDHFQPPISTSNDSGKFVAYLCSIMFTHVDHSSKHPDSKPNDFWDVLPLPTASHEEVEQLMGKPTYENEVEKAYAMSEGTENILTIKYTQSSKGNVSYSSWIAIKQQSEIISRDFFNRSHEFENFPFLRSGHTAIIKWLFDNQLLLIDKDLYQKGLKPDSEEILDFVEKHLNNHLWKNQLADVEYLSSFLYSITTNRKFTNPEGNPVSFYFRDIILSVLHQKDTFERLIEENYHVADQFLNDIVFDEDLYKKVSFLLTQKLKLFQSWKTIR